MSGVKRVFVEKKKPFAVNAKELLEEIGGYLGIKTITDVRVLIRYDIENLSEETYKKALTTVFSEPPVDDVYEGTFPAGKDDFVFSVEYLPGQFDQRADSAEQCVKFFNENETPVIKTAVTYVLTGTVTDEEKNRIKEHCINPVDSRQAAEDIPETLVTEFKTPADVIYFDGFKDMPEDKLKELYDSLGLAMTFKDFKFIQEHFASVEKRDPSMTEIRVLDTYWSDHCRHTTFATELTDVKFKDGFYKAPMEATYNKYLSDRAEIYKDRKDKFVCLMDLALMGAKKLKAEGKLADQEESDEINACSIVVPVEIDGKTEEWLVNFKNETHNHPTEIEPFGGAATCLGGAIRDPLSGRTYVYQAMRITGAADPTVPVSETIHGKLPQRKLVTGAAHGYSSYGNQIGLATGYVKEIYHPDYVAKRMEIGAVIAAAPRSAVKRENSDPGDIIILLGGRTGRDGCGGATGSSKVHTEKSIEDCGAEVQKGNAPTERKMQRLFRRPEVTKLIKKCNDFGAGGVSVAIGELAAGLKVDLDKVPKKYEGLDGTELAISESQERMAVVVDIPSQEDDYLKPVKVTDVRGKWLKTLADLNECSQKGLVERFDGSIGAGSVYMPYGGKYQLTETQSMVAKLPVLKGSCDTVTMMSYGFDPYLSSWSPYHGAIYAVTDSVAKIVAAGGDFSKIRFTYQEYFRRMTEDPERWSQPFAALLGAYEAQMGFGLPSIGGKDSMSGTFEHIDVPPTLCSFAIDVAKEGDIITPELKNDGDVLVRFDIKKNQYDLPDFEQVKALYSAIHELIQKKAIVSAYVLDANGLVPALSKMAFGNKLGFEISADVKEDDLFAPAYGCIVAEVPADKLSEITTAYTKVGTVKDNGKFTYKEVSINVEEALSVWADTLEGVFPTKASKETTPVESKLYEAPSVHVCKNKVAKPTVFIPVFPGTNCEYDSAKAFERAGADTIVKVFKNLDAESIRESVDEFEKAINQAQIIMFPGGFSAGDEPDGSAKFFATAFRNAKMKEAVEKLLNERDGLALGICNGFQALIKLGLVPNGKITGQDAQSPTLTFNTINRHISKMVYTKVVSNLSPWLANAELGGVYCNPASHGEGRFVAPKEWLDKLFANGQVATQYCDLDGNVSMDEEWNINGSYMAIEGITSPDGRCFGKMAHSERRGDSVAINIYGEQDIKIFESGVKYFK